MQRVEKISKPKARGKGGGEWAGLPVLAVPFSNSLPLRGGSHPSFANRWHLTTINLTQIYPTRPHPGDLIQSYCTALQQPRYLAGKADTGAHGTD